jgi:hypothetical protein
MAFCTNCGHESETTFCSNCGTKISTTNSVPNSSQDSVLVSVNPLGEQQVSAPASAASQKKALYIAIPVAIAAIVILLVVLAAPKNPFPSAIDACGISDGDTYIYIGDNGKTLLMDGEGETSAGATSSDVWCVLQELNVPESTVAQMEKTSSLMGVVSDSWDGISADWSYHPDNGFDVVLKFEN